MFLSQLWLTNFRNYENTHLLFNEGITLITGDNGNGKTNLLEAIAWFSKGKSFRGAPNEALIFESDTETIEGEINQEPEVQLLERQLQKAIDKEEYEMAARIRDKIKEIDT